MSVNQYPRVPYAMTIHDQKEIDAVVEVLKTSTQMGDKTRDFEKKVADIYGHKFGIGTNSGSSSLYIAMEIFKLPKGSEVITPVLTFATTIGCIIKSGCIPAFVDSESSKRFTIDVNKIENMINKNTKAMVIPNLMGNMPNWIEIKRIAEKYNLKILEDSADVIGANYDNKKSGYYSDIAITSFYGMHMINCAGNGGMILTSNEEYNNEAKLLRSWGRSSSLFVDSEKIENRFNVYLDNIQYDAKFVFEIPGYNMEGSEIGAAFGLVQLQSLEKNIDVRIKNFSRQIQYFDKYPAFFDNPAQNHQARSGFLAFPLLIKESAPFSRKQFQIYLEKRNIQTRVCFTGNVLRQPMTKNIEKRFC